MKFTLFDESGYRLAQTFTFARAKREADELADRTGAEIIVATRTRSRCMFAPPGFKCVYARNVAAATPTALPTGSGLMGARIEGGQPKSAVGAEAARPSFPDVMKSAQGEGGCIPPPI